MLGRIACRTLLILGLLGLPGGAAAVEILDLVGQDGVRRTVEGQILVEAADGGVLLQQADGAIVSAQPGEIVRRTRDDRDFEPMSHQELAAALLKEMPAGFQIHRTERFLICHNTSDEYARWCGALFERLYAAFTNFWKRRDVELHEPKFPLVALVFSDQASYARHTRAELGDAADQIIGFYNFGTNRVTTYDLTGAQALAGLRAGGRGVSIQQMLRHPEAERLVATIIHEATHQLAFNTGLQTRYADNPLWVSEGLAMYFETPDLRSSSGWRTIGAVNTLRLGQFQQNAVRRGTERLQRLISDDTFMRGAEASTVAYAEAWALTYFLIRAKRPQFDKYLAKLAEKPRLVWDDPETRLREFQEAFGDLRQLDREFMLYMSRVRAR